MRFFSIFGYALLAILGVAAKAACAGDLPPTCNPNASEAVAQKEFDKFVKLFYQKKDLAGAANTYISASYRQHNPDLLDGRQALINGLGGLWANPATSFKVKAVIHDEEGSLVLAEAIFAGGPKMVVYDLFRRQGSCIVEHWDAMMEMKNKTVSAHPYW